MHKRTKTHSAISPLAAISLFTSLMVGALSAHAQDNASSGGDVVVDQPGQQLVLGGEPINGNVIVSGPNTSILLSPGANTVNGNMTINGQGSAVVVKFDKKKQYGSLQVSGVLNLGPDNAPTLALDLSNARFTPGEKLLLLSAGQLSGEFSGHPNGSMIQSGPYTFEVSYDAGNFTVIVDSIDENWYPQVTPVIDFDTSLINPTSTAPRN